MKKESRNILFGFLIGIALALLMFGIIQQTKNNFILFSRCPPGTQPGDGGCNAQGPTPYSGPITDDIPGGPVDCDQQFGDNRETPEGCLDDYDTQTNICQSINPGTEGEGICGPILNPPSSSIPDNCGGGQCCNDNIDFSGCVQDCLDTVEELYQECMDNALDNYKGCICTSEWQDEFCDTGVAPFTTIAECAETFENDHDLP